MAFLYELSQTNAVPASIRLVDNLQFQFGMALKPKAEGFKALKSKLEKFFVVKLKGFDPQQMVACTIVFEGSRQEVASQEKTVYGLAKRHGGMKAGAENGIRGYQLTFGIAYIRDFVMKHYFLAESFETSVPWSQVEALCANVKKRLADEYERRQLPGKPFITCRVTQVYETGVCVYFYFGYYYKGVAHPSEIYAELEVIAREEIMKNGGSLSHHHGIGKLRQRFPSSCFSGGGLTSNLRLPQTRTTSAPTASSRCASPSVCAITPASDAKAGRSKLARRAYPRAERSERRAFAR